MQQELSALLGHSETSFAKVAIARLFLLGHNVEIVDRRSDCLLLLVLVSLPVLEVLLL